jgi:hypothetical protein
VFELHVMNNLLTFSTLTAEGTSYVLNSGVSVRV